MYININMIIYIISLISISIIINYFRLKSYSIIHIPFISEKDENKLNILTFNSQRLPFLLTRPSNDVKKLLKSYDVICLQENFCSLFGHNHHHYDVNCIIPEGNFFKFVNSGLSIYSNYKIEYIKFISFKNLKNIDRFSNKGYLVVKIKDLYIINTHLQANYNSKEYPSIALKQLEKIMRYCKKFKKVIICGDFNLDIRVLNNLKEYEKVVPYKPTHWCKDNTIFNFSSAEKKCGMKPFYYDGALYKNITVSGLKVDKIDDYSDHLGVSFDVDFE